jgi:hypothetical protein
VLRRIFFVLLFVCCHPSSTSSTMSSLKLLNPNADIARSVQALSMAISASGGLQSVLKSNLGPKGTIKMYVVASGDCVVVRLFVCLVRCWADVLYHRWLLQQACVWCR